MNQFSADVIQKAISFQNRNQSMKRLHPKCKFSEEEDELLKNLVSEMLKSNDTNIDNDDVKNENLVNSAIATIDWNKVALSMKTSRNARQCRERYLNYLIFNFLGVKHFKFKDLKSAPYFVKSQIHKRIFKDIVKAHNRFPPK